MVNVIAFDVPPPGPGVNTVTGIIPGLAISAAEIDALSPVTPTKVVVRVLPFHCTTEQGSKLLFWSSFTVRINAAAPASAEAGESDVIDGADSVVGGVNVSGVTIVNGIAFEITVGLLDTVMFTVPTAAVSAAVIAAVTCVALTKVVGRGEPFQFTTTPLPKPVPLTVSVRPTGLQYAVDADPVVDAERDVMVGATTGNATPLDAPPPPPDVVLKTVTVGDPTDATSVAKIAAVSCVELTYVVARVTPFHCTTEHGTKLLPAMVKENAPVPAVVVAGEIASIAGTGSAELGAEAVNGKVFEMTAKLDTETCAVP
jgi:hypothetical protein